MGTSVTKIDRTYGHLARDSEESIRRASRRDRIVWAPNGPERRVRR